MVIRKMLFAILLFTVVGDMRSMEFFADLSDTQKACLVTCAAMVSAGLYLCYDFCINTDQNESDQDEPFDAPKIAQVFVTGAASEGSESLLPAKSYLEVFDPLVQGVLEGDLAKVTAALDSGANPFQRISYNKTLRHLAYQPEIDDLLKSLGVAPLEPIVYQILAAEDLDRFGGDLQAIPAEIFEKQFGRNPNDKDLLGRYPEDYSWDQKRIEAIGMMRSAYR